MGKIIVMSAAMVAVIGVAGSDHDFQSGDKFNGELMDLDTTPWEIKMN